VKRSPKYLLSVVLLLSAAVFSQTSLDSRLIVLDPIVDEAIAQPEVDSELL